MTTTSDHDEPDYYGHDIEYEDCFSDDLEVVVIYSKPPGRGQAAFLSPLASLAVRTNQLQQSINQDVSSASLILTVEFSISLHSVMKCHLVGEVDM